MRAGGRRLTLVFPMDETIITQLRDRHADHKSAGGPEAREQTRASCLRLLEQLEAQAQGEAGSLAASLSSNRVERMQHVTKLDALVRCLALLDGLQAHARAQVRMNWWLDLPVGIVALAAGAAVLDEGRPHFALLAAIGVVTVGQSLGRTQPLSQRVRAVLAELATADVRADMADAPVPLEKWRPLYLWGVSSRKARAIAEAVPELRSKLQRLIAKWTDKVDESLASSVRLLVLFAPPAAEVERAIP